MKVFILGGTGFIGFHAALEFLNRGHQVDTISLPDIPLGDWFPRDRIGVRYGDIFELSKEELTDLLRGYEGIVYAVGPDDRVVPKAPAYSFFQDAMVETSGKVWLAAKEAGVRRCVLCGSYFSHFDRTMPELKLAAHHSYIRCRVEQEERCLNLSGDTMDTMVLQLPYIFGVMPERVPMWKDIFLNRIKKMPGAIYYFRGGSVMMTVEQVAECVAGAIEKGQAGQRYPCGDENVDWDTWLTWIKEAAGMSKPIVHIPVSLGAFYGSLLKVKNKVRGLENGLDYGRLFHDIQSRYLYYESFNTSTTLGVSRGGVRESVIKTIKACL